KVQEWVNHRIDLAKEWYLIDKNEKFDINYVVIRGDFKGYYLGVKSEPEPKIFSTLTGLIGSMVEKLYK
ncbi:TPA: hypothetical protein ACIB0G_004516, partial [Salmonella enterica subsp. enterica serovar Enteritidis]